MYYIKFPAADECAFATAGRYITKNKPTHPRRILDTTVLLIGRHGECPIAQDGREYILAEGDYILLMEGHEHYGTAPVSAGQSHYWCHFKLPAGAELFESDTTPCPTDGYCVIPEYGHVVQTERIRMLFFQLIDSYCRDYTDGTYKSSICSDYTRIMLCELADGYVCSVREKELLEKKPSALAARLREYIELHACEGAVSVTESSRLLHYNSNYLAQVFKSEVGESITAYANRVRVKEACTLLLNTDMRIGRIAAEVGFADEKYFMRVFRRIIGVTPSEYRRTYFRMHTNTR